MHFGGIHFFASLLLLAGCVGVTLGMLYLGYLTILLLRTVLYKARYSIAEKNWIQGAGPAPDEVVSPPSWSYRNPQLAKKLMIGCTVFLSLIYVYQRSQWMRDDNSYYEAKEYWVAGQVVNSHRMVIGQYLHPENPLNYPYTLLLRAIYKMGVTYLPKNDGERYVWKNQWFLYHYTRKKDRPYFVTSYRYEPKMVALLDSCWSSLQGMASNEYQDKRMIRLYALGYPNLASYYSILQSHYTGKLFGGGTLRRKDPGLMGKLYELFVWLDNVESVWAENGYEDEVKGRYSWVPACRQEALMNILQNLTLSLVITGEFRCDHPLVERLYEEYLNSMSEDPERNPFLQYKDRNRKQAKLLYKSALYGSIGSSGHYLLRHICERDFPEEQYVVVSKQDHFCFFESKDDVEFVYRDELKNILEEAR
ncbi:hypothetical protein [Desulfoluna butyratoxydans]|uniref:Uncharacterized protein n=1 Tax=Desulfoluna butyratoxydans TaxID=231438 RepID=A0A4U8YP15_9BACT|nr:hypothetical protein [Desulfoluna butyratoxydans]VFQ45404.1 hypothetical protein MSL71_30610 [Desulfoluna butyratoxydans]